MGFVQEDFFIASPTPAFLFLMKQFHITQKEAQRWLDKQRVKSHDRICHKKDHLQGLVSVTYFKPEPHNMEPIFYNNHFALFDKPPHLLCHPKGYFNAPSMLDHIKAFHPQATLVHRLDKETSGLLLVACNPQSTQELGVLFMYHHIQKTYLAYVKGQITMPQTIVLPLLQSQKGGDLSVRMKIDIQGKHASTHIIPIKYDPHTHTTLIYALPYTGRTHQIRAHLQAINHPILGDPLYGCKDEYARFYLDLKSQISEKQYKDLFGAKRLMLHACKLEFTFKKQHFIFTSPTTLSIKDMY